MVLARGQHLSKLFDNLSAFRHVFFMNNLPILMGILVFSMSVAPIMLFRPKIEFDTLNGLLRKVPILY